MLLLRPTLPAAAKQPTDAKGDAHPQQNIEDVDKDVEEIEFPHGAWPP
jgi:hypothetical protein